MPDGLGRVGAVDAVDRVAEIERARAHRIARPAGHEARQVRLPLDHLRRRRPVRPFLLAGDLEQPVPLEAVAADADAVAQRDVVGLDQIKKAALGIDDDRARVLRCFGSRPAGADRLRGDWTSGEGVTPGAASSMVGVIMRKSRGVPYCAWLAMGASRTATIRETQKQGARSSVCLVSEKWNRRTRLRAGSCPDPGLSSIGRA